MMSEPFVEGTVADSAFPVWSSNLLKSLNVLHFFTTRLGGVSPPPYDSLNLGFSSQDDPKNVIANRKRVEDNFQVLLRSFAIQVHKNDVLILKEKTKLPDPNELPPADAILSNISDLSICMFFADCLPIFLWDPVKKGGGLAHAGWRSTLADIGPRSVEVLEKEFGSHPRDIRVAFGPSIGPCCFEVGASIAEFFQDKFGKEVILAKNEKRFVNLWEANRQSLAEKGVKGGNMELAGECTACQSSRYYSYRRDKRRTGRMAGVLKISK